LSTSAWLPIFRGIAAEVHLGVAPLIGTARGQEVVGRGAGGDATVYLDAVAEGIVVRHLETAYRSGLRFRLRSEELGERDFGGPELVLVDPLDGSLNAKYGVPYYALTLAVADGNRLKDVRLGFVVNLVNQEEFTAERGQGARHNGAPLTPAPRAAANGRFAIVQVEAGERHIDAVARTGPLLRNADRIRVLGSAALNLCHTATGAIAVHIAPLPVRTFDLAGPLLILHEAGGLATAIDGSSLAEVASDLTSQTTVLASPSVDTHAEALRRLAVNA
jgi:myo-inositol-1(or 4)-monophosphatase